MLLVSFYIPQKHAFGGIERDQWHKRVTPSTAAEVGIHMSSTEELI